MLILSWNVAAWEPIISQLSPPSQEGVLEFFNKHKADIFCLQEVKVSRYKLEHEPDKVHCKLPGWESFWAVNEHKSSKGFHGVATFTKKGLTTKADRSPFKCPQLNSMGRCLRTEHSRFVIFNVYAPAACNPGGLEMRLKFYMELREAMQKAMGETGKPVILCGDLNVQLNPRDLHYTLRRVRVDLLLKGERRCLCGWLKENKIIEDSFDRCETSKDCCNFKIKLRETWPSIQMALKHRKVFKQVTYSANNIPRNKYHVKIPVKRKVEKMEEYIRVGELHDSEEEAYAAYNLDPIYADLHHLTGETEPVLCFPRQSVSVEKLKDLLEVVANFKLSIFECVRLADNCGESRNALPLLCFIKKMMREDNYEDILLRLHPNLDYRFTCWSQYTNRRYVNIGGRIDYFLIHNSLVDAVNNKLVELRCGCVKHKGADQYSWEAGVCAATAGGRYRQASFSGGGIQEASKKVMDTQYNGSPHTGIIYTPPKWSDHVAISLFLDNNILPPDACTLSEDKQTRSTQPYRKQRSIKTFFTAGNSNESKALKLEPNSSCNPKRKALSIWERSGFRKSKQAR